MADNYARLQLLNSPPPGGYPMAGQFQQPVPVYVVTQPIPAAPVETEVDDSETTVVKQTAPGPSGLGFGVFGFGMVLVAILGGVIVKFHRNKNRDEILRLERFSRQRRRRDSYSDEDEDSAHDDKRRRHRKRKRNAYEITGFVLL
eukprot:Gregarina_sp_Poly_1__3347@NODE_1966_length_2979_cov_1113_632555_g1266_i0_p3_GENE_NODE_1966_length_2979_cov_1113_632555_g1266_i0NODE_1966_length_2979_cov_1113_632555_g1266_i0_p3_ORF_typecomplete_len145_score27_10FAM176/PF14851_6/0_033Protocadherin/PF08374_11/0_17_NODE_1966_length_2979_cov_1113_632555_g1266_i024512885